MIPDEEFSDEELELTGAYLERALRTRSGGRELSKKDAQNDDDRVTSSAGKSSHEKNSRTGLTVAQNMWSSDTNTELEESITKDNKNSINNIILKSETNKQKSRNQARLESMEMR